MLHSERETQQQMERQHNFLFNQTECVFYMKPEDYNPALWPTPTKGLPQHNTSIAVNFSYMLILHKIE